MKTIETISGHVIEMFDDIDEMPLDRYHRFSKFAIMADGVGSDMNAFAARVNDIGMYIDNGMNEKAKTALRNLLLMVDFASRAYHPDTMAFAALVRSVDGVVCDDITDGGLERTSGRIKGMLTKGEADSAMDSVKKKIGDDIRFYFPSAAAQNTEQVSLMCEKYIRMLEALADDTDAYTENIDRRLAELSVETDFTGEWERDFEVSYEKNCIVVTENLHKDAKTMSVKEYYSSIELLTDRAREQERKYGK